MLNEREDLEAEALKLLDIAVSRQQSALSKNPAPTVLILGTGIYRR
jgi:hypothetical protein